MAIADDLPAVMGDPQELQQVLLNAVVNARQAIEAIGRPGQGVARATRYRRKHATSCSGPTGRCCKAVQPGQAARVLERVASE